MKFLYKISSNFDKFTPEKIEDRMIRGRLQLHWGRYLEVAELGDEVWVYFLGRDVDQPGVYAKGTINRINPKRRRVWITLHTHSTTRVLVRGRLAKRLGDLVAPRGRTVSILPELNSRVKDPRVCAACPRTVKGCATCPFWRSLSLIGPRSHYAPQRLDGAVDGFAAAYWVIPNRCYLHHKKRKVANRVKLTTQLFYRYKLGETHLARPLARGMFQALRAREFERFDCIVPVPLSPKKARAGEIHRTLLLAKHLSQLTGAPVSQAVKLKRSISKKKLRTEQGHSAAQFENRYGEGLRCSRSVRRHRRILLVDDVATEGSTLRACASVLASMNEDLEIVAVTAGQMILKNVVARETRLLQRR